MAMERWRPISGPSSVVDRWEPFRNLGEIQGEVNRLFDTFAGRPTGRSGSSTWLPLVDMSETTDDLVVTVEVAGVHEKDIALSITGDMLSIKGERRWQASEDKNQKVLHSERPYGTFERFIQLPIAVQAERVKATYRDGLLEITLPKTENLRPHEIKIDLL